MSDDDVRLTESGTIQFHNVPARAGEKITLVIDFTSRGRRNNKRASVCTCTPETGCPEDENPCSPCSLLDPYEPCPALRFGDDEEIDR